MPRGVPSDHANSADILIKDALYENSVSGVHISSNITHMKLPPSYTANIIRVDESFCGSKLAFLGSRLSSNVPRGKFIKLSSNGVVAAIYWSGSVKVTRR